MDNLNNLKDLFYHQLKDIYNAETQLINALSTMEEKASNNDLKNAFAKHLDETKAQKSRLEGIGQTLNIDLRGENCEAMQGLIDEARSLINKNADGDVRDAGIIADAQRIEHYEISAYGTAVQYAQALNQGDVANTLQQTLDEESNADKTLSNLAIENINKQAKSLV